MFDGRDMYGSVSAALSLAYSAYGYGQEDLDDQLANESRAGVPLPINHPDGESAQRPLEAETYVVGRERPTCRLT
jgi:hypothetical protein